VFSKSSYNSDQIDKRETAEHVQHVSNALLMQNKIYKNAIYPTLSDSIGVGPKDQFLVREAERSRNQGKQCTLEMSFGKAGEGELKSSLMGHQTPQLKSKSPFKTLAKKINLVEDTEYGTEDRRTNNGSSV
jgi:hypothetical protein